MENSCPFILKKRYVFLIKAIVLDLVLLRIYVVYL